MCSNDTDSDVFSDSSYIKMDKQVLKKIVSKPDGWCCDDWEPPTEINGIKYDNRHMQTRNRNSR